MGDGNNVATSRPPWARALGARSAWLRRGIRAEAEVVADSQAASRTRPAARSAPHAPRTPSPARKLCTPTSGRAWARNRKPHAREEAFAAVSGQRRAVGRGRTGRRLHALPARAPRLEVSAEVIDSPDRSCSTRPKTACTSRRPSCRCCQPKEKEIRAAAKLCSPIPGGLDTSIIIPWLKETYGGCEVIAMIGDSARGRTSKRAHKKALATRRAAASIEDSARGVRHRLDRPTLRAGAVYEQQNLLGTSFARRWPSARWNRAAQSGADALAHGCTGKGNDQVRFELAYKAIAPRLAIIAPGANGRSTSREDAIAVCARASASPSSKPRARPLQPRPQHLAPQPRRRRARRSRQRAGRSDVAMDGGARQGAGPTHRWWRSDSKAASRSPSTGRARRVALIDKLNALAERRRRTNRHGREPPGRHEIVRRVPNARGTLRTAHAELEALSLDRETSHYRRSSPCATRSR